jgi:hypothetical protein
MRQKIELIISKYWYLTIPVIFIFLYFLPNTGGKGTIVKNTIESVGNIVYQDTILKQWPKYNSFSSEDKKCFLLLLNKDANKNFINDCKKMVNQDIENKTQKVMFNKVLRKIELDLDSLSTTAN